MLSDIEHLTPAELSAMTGPQIASLRWQGETVGSTELEHDKDGNVVTQTTVTRYVLGDAKAGSVIVDFTYYRSGVVDEITTRTLDDKDNEIGRRVVKNYDDGRPPEVIEEVVTPILEPLAARASAFPRRERRIFGMLLHDPTFWQRLRRRLRPKK